MLFVTDLRSMVIALRAIVVPLQRSAVWVPKDGIWQWLRRNVEPCSNLSKVRGGADNDKSLLCLYFLIAV